MSRHWSGLGVLILALGVMAGLGIDSGLQQISDGDAAQVKGAGWWYCGGEYWLSNGDTCNRARNGAWSCGPQLDISTPGWGDYKAKSASCGAGCAGNGSVHNGTCT
jgi:hypothetical protein